MKKIKYVTIDGKKWQVVNKTLDINEIIKNSEEKISKEWQAQNDFVAMLAGFMPKVDTCTEYGEVNPTMWGEEVK